MIACLRFETLTNHNFNIGGTYLFGPHMGVAPPPPPPPLRNKDNMC